MHVAAITCALIVGAYAERMKFSAVLLFMALWFTFSYLPMAHMVWYWDGPDAIKDAATETAVKEAAGWLWAKGALDFAGGTVAHQRGCRRTGRRLRARQADRIRARIDGAA